MSGSHGAGRFLPQDFDLYQSMDPFISQPVSPAAQGMAYQPNYNLFWNPSEMLALGSPQFSSPWYNQTPTPTPPPPAPAQTSQLSAGTSPMLGINEMRIMQSLPYILGEPNPNYTSYLNPLYPGGNWE